MASRRRTLVDALLARVRGRTAPDDLPVRCAWCGKISLSGTFVEPDEFLAHGIPATPDERTSDGICPECFDRESAKAAAARAQKKN